MAINKNHLFEDIDEVKCAIVESGIPLERVEFITSILTYNGYTVLVIEEITKKISSTTDNENINIQENKTYKVGTPDVTFNVTNAIFGRSLKTKNGKIVTLQYWNQEEETSNDSIPYFENKVLDSF